MDERAIDFLLLFGSRTGSCLKVYSIPKVIFLVKINPFDYINLLLETQLKYVKTN